MHDAASDCRGAKDPWQTTDLHTQHPSRRQGHCLESCWRQWLGGGRCGGCHPVTSCVLKDAGGRRCRQGETFCHHDAPGQIHHCSRPGQDTDAAETRLHSTQPLPVVHPVGWPAASNCPIQSLSPQLDLYRLQLSCRGACREHLVALQPVCILTRAPCSLPSVHGSACCVPLERPSLHEQWTSTGTLQCSTTPCLPQSCRPMIGAGYMATWLPWQVDAQLPHLLAASKLTQGLNGIAVLGR